MTNDLSAFLEDTLADTRLSRAEVKVLLSHFQGGDLAPTTLDRFATQALRLASKKLKGPRDDEVRQWLYDVFKVLRRAERRESPINTAIAAFSPGDEPKRHITRLVRNAVSQIDCCVFTITDNELADALVEAHQRGVAVRIISDNDKSHDLGSDVDRLDQRGISVRLDRTDAHMHP